MSWPSRSAVGHAFGVSGQTVTDWVARGMPGEGGHYDVTAVCRWFRAWMLQRMEEAASDPDMVGGDGSPALEEYRKEKTLLARMDRKEREKALVKPDAVEELMRRGVEVLSRAGEAIQKRFGPDAAALFNEAIEEALRFISETDLGGDGGDTDE
jgi:hypothetical protein